MFSRSSIQFCFLLLCYLVIHVFIEYERGFFAGIQLLLPKVSNFLEVHSLSFIRTILLEHEVLKIFLIKNTQEQFRLKFIQKVL